MTIAIDGVDYDTIKIALDAIEQESAVQHLKALAKELSFPRIDRLRSILRDGWGLVTEIGPTGRPSVFTDSLVELILVYRPVAPGDTETMAAPLSADEVRTYALQMLRALYRDTGADVRKSINVAVLGDATGLTELAPIEHVLSYLVAKQLIVKELYSARITPLGIENIERALEHPDKPAAPYLPAINVINAQTINLASGAQLMQGAGTLKQTSHSGIGLSELREALTRIETLARTLETANREQIEILVKAVRVETDRDQPSHSRIRTLLSSMKTIAETFIGGAAANLATSTDPANAPAIVELIHHLISRLP